MVLLHGFTQTLSSWDPVAERLRAGHEVVRVDAPGHGGSASVATDLPGAARALAACGGRAAYVGYSMGGRICLRLAADQPDLVTKLALISSSPGLAGASERQARRAADEITARAIEAEGVDRFLGQWLAQPMFATLPAEAAGLDDRRANSSEGLTAALRLMGTGVQEPLWDRLPGLRMPVLLIAGAWDQRYCDLARRMAAAIGPSAELAIVAGVGHAAHLEAPEPVGAILESFLG